MNFGLIFMEGDTEFCPTHYDVGESNILSNQSHLKLFLFLLHPSFNNVNACNSVSANKFTSERLVDYILNSKTLESKECGRED